MVDRTEFNTVMGHFADRFRAPLPGATADLYREAIDEAGVTTEEFRLGARRVFRVAGSWAFASPEAFVKAAKAVRRDKREAAEREAERQRAQEREAERIEREAFSAAVPFTPTPMPRFESYGQRSTRCDCGRWFRQTMLAIGYVDACSERWRAALMDAFPQGLVPDECPRCTRLTIGQLAHRSAPAPQPAPGLEVSGRHADTRELAWSP